MDHNTFSDFKNLNVWKQNFRLSPEDMWYNPLLKMGIHTHVT